MSALTSRPRAQGTTSKNGARTIALLSERNLFREGLRQLLRRRGHRDVIESTSLRNLLTMMRRRRVGLVLVDLDHRPDDPRTIVRAVRGASPNASVVMIGTTLQNAALARTADGWLEFPDATSSRLDRMATAAERPHPGRLMFRQSTGLIHERRIWGALTRRQQEVLELLSNGADNLKLAAELGVSERTIKAHISTLLRRFGVENRSELAVLSARAGLRGSLSAVGHAW